MACYTARSFSPHIFWDCDVDALDISVILNIPRARFLGIYQRNGEDNEIKENCYDDCRIDGGKSA